MINAAWEHIIKTSTNSQSCINLRYECTCLFSCMLSSRMHHAARHAYCSALLHSLWLRVAFPPSWQHLFGRRAAAWVSLSDGANESHVTPGRGAGELRWVKVNQGKIMLKRWNVPASGFSNNFLQLPSGKKNFRGNLPARLVQFCPSLKLCYWVYTVEKGSHVKERDPALEAMQ